MSSLSWRALLIVLFAFAPASALASFVPYQGARAGLEGPFAPEDNPLTIQEVAVEVACSQPTSCTLTARFLIHNPTAAQVTGSAAFLLNGATSYSLLLAGEDVLCEAPERALEGSYFLAREDPEGTIERVEACLTLDAKTSLPLVVEASLTPTRVPESPLFPAVLARHLVFSGLIPDNFEHFDDFNLGYWGGSLKEWGFAQPVQLTTTLPPAWAPRHMESSRLHPYYFNNTPSRERSEGPDTQLVSELRFDEEYDGLLVYYTEPSPTIYPGGLILGLGAQLDPDNGEPDGIYGRVGWEVSGPSWIFYGATLESNFDDSLVLVPHLHLASPAVLMPPSLGLGVGLPLRLMPELSPALRLSADVHMLPIGCSFFADFRPWSDERGVELGLLGVISL